jgi:hypothetical protein
MVWWMWMERERERRGSHWKYGKLEVALLNSGCRLKWLFEPKARCHCWLHHLPSVYAFAFAERSACWRQKIL